MSHRLAAGVAAIAAIVGLQPQSRFGGTRVDDNTSIDELLRLARQQSPPSAGSDDSVFIVGLAGTLIGVLVTFLIVARASKFFREYRARMTSSPKSLARRNLRLLIGVLLFVVGMALRDGADRFVQAESAGSREYEWRQPHVQAMYWLGWIATGGAVWLGTTWVLARLEGTHQQR